MVYFTSRYFPTNLGFYKYKEKLKKIRPRVRKDKPGVIWRLDLGVCVYIHVYVRDYSPAWAYFNVV